MSKYTRKKDKVEDKDEFVSFWEKAFIAAAPYARAIGVSGVVAVIIVAAAWGGVAWSQNRTESSTEAIGKALKVYGAEVTTGDVDPAKPDPKEKPDPTAPPKYKTDKERLEATLAEAKTVQKDHSGAVRDEAALLEAAALFDLGKLDEAIVIYQQVADKQTGALQQLAHESWGLVLEQQGKLDDARKQYELAMPKQGDFYRDRALYAQARVAIAKSDKKKAMELFTEIVTKLPNTPLKEEIQNQVALLGEQMPKPVPPPAPTTGSPVVVPAPKPENK